MQKNIQDNQQSNIEDRSLLVPQSGNNQFTPELKVSEKSSIIRNVFVESKENNDKYIRNIADYITDNFKKIDGFDWRWSSLITNNPLLFEDVDYLRIRDYIDNQVTQEEIDAYQRGDLSDLYATFDNMLVCNLKYYDRIISYCTMIFMHYIRLDDALVNQGLERLPWMMNLTPTKIWCAAMINNNSTTWEINYGWGTHNMPDIAVKPIPGSPKSVLEVSWNKLYRNPTFKMFNEYNAYRVGTTGFRETLISDITNNRKLAQVCSKFTKTSMAISEQQLDTIFDYVKEINVVKDKLFISLDSCLSNLFHGDKSQYAIYIFQDEFFIFTSRFTLRTGKNDKGMITKDYIANSWECFAAEEFLVPSIQMQIEWAKYKVPAEFVYDKDILKVLLFNMLEENYKGTVCMKRMNDYGMVSKVSFKGHFNNVVIIEEFLTDNRIIKSFRKILSKQNAANYLVDKGYFLFGIESDILEMISTDNASGKDKVNKGSLIAHYNNYCIPVLQHMFDIISMHNMSKNDIIDVLTSDTINPAKFNNDNIRYTSMSKIDAKELFSKGLDQQNRAMLQRKSNYWRVVE